MLFRSANGQNVLWPQVCGSQHARCERKAVPPPVLSALPGSSAFPELIVPRCGLSEAGAPFIECGNLEPGRSEIECQIGFGQGLGAIGKGGN